MNVRFFNPGKGYLKIKDEIDSEMQRVLTNGDLILRGDLEAFEESFAKYVGTEYAVGVANGTDALVMSLQALGIGEGDEVIVPSYTFRATVEVVIRVGATPILADIGEDWHEYKSEFTKAIIPAHIAGETLDWEPDEGIVMIEDACQAVGVKPVTGETACYSFYPAKVLGCYGDGGAIATNDRALAKELKDMRNHYKATGDKTGYNSRLDNLQAAILNVRLKHLPDDIRRRKEVAKYYDEQLEGYVGIPVEREVYQDYIITCESERERDSLYDFLSEAGVETMKNGYPFPKLTPKKVKTLYYESVSLRIPCNPELTDEEIEYVIEKIHEFYNK